MTETSPKPQIGCYILCYYFPEFVRTAALLQALHTSQDFHIYEAINSHRGWWRYWQTIRQLIHIRWAYNPDFYILGFRGYELFWLVRLITWGKPLLFDHMMSPYDSLVFEKKKIRSGSLLSRLVYYYERSILKQSDVVLTDTVMHQSYFADLFQLPQDHIWPVHVAADETLFTPCPPPATSPSDETFHIFFYGSFLPLHGLDVILEAAAMLTHLPIHFTLVGGHKQDLTHFHQSIKVLGIAGQVTHRPWIEYVDLPDWACRADLCLGGPFGNTGQAQRVITGKTFQFLALGKPTVVGRVEPNPYFTHQYNCLLVEQGHPQALAEAIAWAVAHRDQLAEIGQNGRQLYDAHFSVRRLQEQMERVLSHALLPT